MTNRKTKATRTATTAAAGFTLVELLVSVALVLILILGVNEVFKLTSDTIGATNGLADAVRTSRSTQTSMFDDLKHAVLPGNGQARGAAFFVIRNERISAFPSPKEEGGDRDYTRSLSQAATDDAIRTVDANGDNVESLAETPERVSMGERSHRIDMISFFARDLYRRQTGNDAVGSSPGVYAAEQTAGEAWVWYGHIKQPNGTNYAGNANFMANSRNPGWMPLASGVETADTSPNNFYARNWFLGRVATLLIAPESGRIIRYDSFGQAREAQYYHGFDPGQASNKPLQPLGQQTDSTTDGVSFADPEIQWARYDVAGTTIASYNSQLKGLLLAYTNNTAINWWQGPEGLIYRFSGFPYPSKPMTPAGAARTVPCFVPACTQFVVEFAGDFISQMRDTNNDGVVDIRDIDSADYGKATAPFPDGVVDFIADPPSTGTGGHQTIRTRWYGFPRNVYTGDDLSDRVVIVGTSSNGNVNVMRDVVPVRDVLRACIQTTASNTVPLFIPALFERDVDNDLPQKPDYGVATGVKADNPRYTCAWGPSGSYTIPDTNGDGIREVVPDPQLPKMVRLVVGIDDTEGRIAQTQYYEYVIELP